MFTNKKEEVVTLLDSFKIEFQLNLAIGILMDHLVFLFKRFKKVILKESSGKGWLTTDNPVYIDKQNKYEWIIPIESEIYMPLSKDYCLFMFHPESENYQNQLRTLKIDRINEIDFNSFDNILKKITRNYDKYLIMNMEIQPTEITKNL